MQEYFEKSFEENDVPEGFALLKYLESTDFYTAPSSTKYHSAFIGGLAFHTKLVMECALALNKKHDLPTANRSVVIAAFCHDLCKVGMYHEVSEAPSPAQINYLKDLMSKKGVGKPPGKLDKGYVSILIDFLLNQHKPGMAYPEYVPTWKIFDSCPLGHGEKSLHIASKFIEMTVDEALAIRWHMGAFDVNFNSPYQSIAFREAQSRSKLLHIISLADIEATFLIE